MHSSSDGKRRRVSPGSQQARVLPRYFGRDRGLTHYGFVSDQHTHFATRVIRTTVRDATYALDGILDNRSQLPIRIHSTDTAGYGDIIFALFDLLGLQFAPRLAGLPDTRLWRTGPAHDSPGGRLLRHRVKPDLIYGQWDELLRVAGSLDQGTVTGSLLVARLYAQQRRSTLAAALQDYGRLVKTEFVLRYLTRPAERRGIHRQRRQRGFGGLGTPSCLQIVIATPGPISGRGTTERPPLGPRHLVCLAPSSRTCAPCSRRWRSSARRFKRRSAERAARGPDRRSRQARA